MLHGLQIFASLQDVDRLAYASLPGPMLGLENVRREPEALGRIRYLLLTDEGADLGSVLLEEKVKDRFVDLTILRPRPPKSRNWTEEERLSLQAQPDRDSRLRVITDVSQRIQDECNQRYEQILTHHEGIVTWFILQLKSELEERQVIIETLERQSHKNTRDDKKPVPKKRDAYGIRDDTDLKLKKLRKIREENTKNGIITISWTTACQRAGINERTARKWASDLRKNWDDPQYS